MSLSNEESKAGGGSAHSAASAPKLREASSLAYAEWKPQMEIHLQRVGAQGVHRQAVTRDEWTADCEAVEQWEKEKFERARATLRGEDVKAIVSPEQEKARSTIKALVDRSRAAFGVLYSVLPDHLRTQVDAHVLTGHASGIWSWLEAKYQSTEEDSVGQMLEEWAMLHQEEHELYDPYRARVDKLREQLVTVKEAPSARMYLLMLVGRLQSRYKQIVLALKASGMLKDPQAVAWDEVHAMINRHEREEIRAGESEATGGMASALALQWRGRSDPRGAGRPANGGAGSGGRAKNLKKPQDKHEKAERDSTIKCFECGTVGHRKRECPDYLARKKAKGADAGGSGKPAASNKPRSKESAAAAQAAAAKSDADAEEPSSGDEDPFEKPASRRRGMAKMVQVVAVQSKSFRSTNRYQVMVGQEEPEIEEADGHDKVEQKESMSRPVPRGIVASVEKKAKSGQSPAEQQGLMDKSFGVDTMASTHISGNRSLFRGLRPCEPIGIEVADGAVIVADQSGTIHITVKLDGGRTAKLPIHNVYYHPSFAANLLSWGTLQEEGWSMHSTPEESFVEMPGGGRLSLSTQGRVSVLHPIEKSNDPAMRSSKSRSIRQVYQLGQQPKMTTSNVASLMRLHEKLGHLSFARMTQIMKGGYTVDVKKIQATEHELREAEERVRECYACAAGRGKRHAYGHRGMDKGNAPCETLHMDTFFVSMQHEGRKWMEYGTVIKDPFTSTKWMLYSQTKDVIPSMMRRAIIQIEKQHGCKVKRVYSDGGSEFINAELKQFYAERGIVMHHSPPGTPQLNGVAERAVGVVKNATRSLLAHGNISDRFWQNACAHAVYLWNRTHVSSRTNMTPYEALHKKKPSVKHLGVFGCDAFYHVPRDQRSTWEPKLLPCVYLGHSSTQNCAAVYSFAKKKILYSRDVTYRCASFEFSGALRAGAVAVDRLLDRLAELNRQGRLHSQVELPIMQEETDEVAEAESIPDATASDAEADEKSAAVQDDAEKKYDIQEILKHRRKGGKLEYQCAWVGYDEPSWEPADTIQEDAPKVVEEYNLRSQQPAMAPRRSPRLNADAVAGGDLDGPDDPEEEPRVQYAMSAVREMLPQQMRGGQGSAAGKEEEELKLNAIACAVRAGIAQLETRTPKTYKAALKSEDWPKWKAAMDAELASCKAKDVWEEVDRSQVPKGAKVLPLKWVYKIKTDSSGGKDSELFKARITAMGNFQQAGRDYGEVYARTAAYKTLRIQLSLSARYGHRLHQMDVPTAFLNAELKEDVYVEIPPGYTDGKEGKVMKLKMSLYGLRQSPRNWWLQLSDFIRSLGFKPTVSDPCLFYKRSRTGRLILIYLFVDDIQASVHPEDQAEWKEYEAMLVKRFNTKLLGESASMLGMRITRDWKAGTITLDQELYITKALEKYGMAECKPAPTPEVVGAAHQAPTEENAKPCDRQRYMELVGTLMYAAVSTRPDIAHAVFYLASNMLAPTVQHQAAADRVLRYLAGTRGLGLIFGSRSGGALGDSRGYQKQEVDVCAFADADWANTKKDRRSITGWVAKLNGDPVSWASKKQQTTALSTCEAELYAGGAAIQEVKWLRVLMQELGLHTSLPSVVHGDNQSAIAVSRHGIRSERTKHVDVKWHFVTESIERGEVEMQWVPTAEQEADIFTKALPLPAFFKLRDALMAPTAPKSK